MERAILRFQNFELDLRMRRFRRDGVEVKLEPRTYSVLTYLVTNRERVVTSRELLKEIWSGRVVSPASVSVCISNVRRAVNDTATRQNVIKTIYGVGYQFVGEVETQTPIETPDLRSRSSAFFGREAELDLLASRTNSHLTLVGGPPGIGKSRFLKEVWDSAETSAPLVRIRNEPLAPPLLWWNQIGLLKLEVHNSPSEGDPYQQRIDKIRLLSSCADQLRSLCREKSLLIALDDLHLSDADSLDLLSFVLASPERNLRFVATFSSIHEQWSQHFRSFLREHVRRDPSSKIELGAMEEPHLESLIRHESPKRLDHEQLVQIVKASAGNPLFALLMLSIRDTSGSPSEAELPADVRTAATAHLDQLSSTARAVAQVAASLGDRFPVSILEKCCGYSRPALLEALEELRRNLVLKPASSRLNFFEFEHAFVRHALYCELPFPNRRQIHEKVGEVMISELHAEESIPEIAFHLSRAGDHRAVSYHVKAAQIAEKRFGFVGAAENYKLALSGFSNPTRLKRFELLLSLGRCQLLSGQINDAKGTFRRASAAARELGEPGRLSEVALRSAPDFFSIECGISDIDLTELLEEAHSVTPEKSDTKLLLAARLILALLWSPGTEKRVSNLCDVVREGLRRTNDLAVRAEVSPALWRANWDERCLRERLEMSELIPHLVGKVEIEKVLVCRIMTVAAFLESGDLPRLDKEISMFAALARRTNHPRGLWYAEMFEAAKWLMHGDFEEAERRYKGFSNHAKKVGDSNGLHSAALHEFLLLWEAGRTRELIKKTEKAIARYPSVPGWRAILAFVHTEEGNVGRARLEYETLKRAGIASAPNRIDWTSTFTLGLAQTCHALGDMQFAEVLYRRLAPYRNREAIAGIGAVAIGCSDRYLGLLAETMGANDLAITHYRSAIDFDNKFGARPWVVHAQLDAARVLERVGRVDESFDLSRGATIAAKEMGMHNVAFKAESLLRRSSKRRLSG